VGVPDKGWFLKKRKGSGEGESARRMTKYLIKGM
jgi:hypothetical protein